MENPRKGLESGVDQGASGELLRGTTCTYVTPLLYNFVLLIDGWHLTSLRPCWYTEQCSKMSFGNLTLFILCKTCGAIFCGFVHQHSRLITWMQTKDSSRCFASPVREETVKG